jgi:SAM-dependent methyltransferase
MAEGDYLSSARRRFAVNPGRRDFRLSGGVIVDEFLAPVREHLDAEAPRLRPLFDVMAEEAKFARWWLDDDLKRLPETAPILEVGGGVFLLAYELAREGFAITVIEPTGVGFGAFDELGEIVLSLAARDGVMPRVVRCKAEEFRSDTQFQFAFSVNVMEHIAAPDVAIERVSASLLSGGSYRFLCPNYVFPYEPHFNIPTFGSKSVTECLLRRRIQASTRVFDPIGVWKSLNWITVPQVRRMAAADASLAVAFQRRTLASMLERAVGNVEFAKRRAPWMVTAVKALRAAGLLRFASLVPATCQPIMDVRLTKLHRHGRLAAT